MTPEQEDELRQTFWTAYHAARADTHRTRETIPPASEVTEQFAVEPSDPDTVSAAVREAFVAAARQVGDRLGNLEVTHGLAPGISPQVVIDEGVFRATLRV